MKWPMRNDQTVEELRSEYRSSMFTFGLMVAISIAFMVFMHFTPWISFAFAALWAAIAVHDYRRWQRELERTKYIVTPPEWVWDGKHWVPAPKVSLVKKEKDDQAPDPQAGD